VEAPKALERGRVSGGARTSAVTKMSTSRPRVVFCEDLEFRHA
jgi:hypothetical protein